MSLKSLNPTSLALGIFVIFVYTLLISPTFSLFANNCPIKTIFYISIFRILLCFIVFQVIGYWLYRLCGVFSRDTETICTTTKEKIDSLVAVLVPIKNEPMALVARMFQHLSKISYSNIVFYVIDDSTKNNKKLIKETAVKYNIEINLVRREKRSGYKAGALNCALSHLPIKVQYILVLDIDHAPLPDIVENLITQLNINYSAAFVQGPQSYSIENANTLTRAYCYKQRIYYDHICPGLATQKALFISGSNFLIRRSAIEEVGGFDETSLTEDLRTSFHLHLKKKTGIFYKGKVATGYAPKDIYTYHRQQRRWAIGTYQNLFYAIRSFIHQPKALSIEQWLLYLGWNGTFYFNGFCHLMLLVFSIIFLFSNLHRYLSYAETIPLLMIIGTFWGQILKERKNKSDSFLSLIKSKFFLFGDSIIFVAAFIDYILQRNITFEVTAKSSQIDTAIPRPHLLYHSFILILIISCFMLRMKLGSIELLVAIWPFFFGIQSLFMILFSISISRQSVKVARHPIG